MVTIGAWTILTHQLSTLLAETPRLLNCATSPRRRCPSGAVKAFRRHAGSFSSWHSRKRSPNTKSRKPPECIPFHAPAWQPEPRLPETCHAFAPASFGFLPFGSASICPYVSTACCSSAFMCIKLAGMVFDFFHLANFRRNRIHSEQQRIRYRHIKR